MFRSGKQIATTVGCSVTRGQQARSAASAMLPPIVRAHMFALRKVPIPTVGSAADMVLCRSFQTSPLSVLARATIPSVETKRRDRGNTSWGKGVLLPFRGDIRGLENIAMVTRAASTTPFSGPFSGDKEKTPQSDKTDGPKKEPVLPKKERPTLRNRFMEPPEDGLTRYPTLKSPQGVLRGLDYMGTAVFALSGTVTAGTVGMDLLGCAIVGTITATGGGTVRDLLVGNTPVFWMNETEYLWMCLITSIVVFFIWTYLAERGFRDDMEVLNWADAMGVGAFCCIGAQAGVRKGLSNIVCVCCGMLTSTFGGVIRDVLCSRPPRILFSHAEIYASTALLGSTVYMASRAAGFSPVGRITAGFIAAGGLRVLAFKTDIRLPSWTQQSEELTKKIQEENDKICE